ncbi:MULTISPECIES: DegV family protein [unclassified Jeotgalibaca]|uniref:DegV family protein n=1 Tax=unclassified Jeotgalibaca TaxID=2621505 RepID=UPI003FCF1825
MPYIITTESGSDISQEWIDRYNIQVVPMHVTLGDKTIDDGSIPVEEIYKYYDETGTLPKTSGSTPEDFRVLFERIFAENPDATIIHVAYSAVTTVSYNSARIAAEDFENIHLVDSKNVSGGLTAVVVATAQFIEENPTATPEEIVAFVEDVRERTRFVFLPQTLTYLKAGGRVSNVQFFGASLLNIHPTIALKNGQLIASKKYRGSFHRCIKNVINDFFKDYDIIPETLTIGGTPGMSAADREVALKQVSEFGFNNPHSFDAGAVISSHGGPGAFGIIAIEKKK